MEPSAISPYFVIIHNLPALLEASLRRIECTQGKLASRSQHICLHGTYAGIVEQDAKESNDARVAQPSQRLRLLQHLGARASVAAPVQLLDCHLHALPVRQPHPAELPAPQLVQLRGTKTAVNPRLAWGSSWHYSAAKLHRPPHNFSFLSCKLYTSPRLHLSTNKISEE